MQNDKSNFKQIYSGCFIILIFVLYASIAYVGCTTKGSDFCLHLNEAAKIKFPDMAGNTYFLWHLGVKLLYDIGLPIHIAAAIFTGLVNVATYYITYRCIRCNSANKLMSSVYTFLIMIAYPIWTIINPYIYRNSGGSINFFHNPTNQMVRPFAVIVFMQFIKIYNSKQANLENKKNGKNYILFSLIMFLSVLGKPSFVQVFMPAMAIFLLIDLIKTKGKSIDMCVKMAVASLPSIVMMFWQMFSIWFKQPDLSKSIEEESHVFISFLYTSGGFGIKPISIYFVKMLLTMAFPIYVFLINPKNSIKFNESKMALLTCGVGTIESMCLFESGPRLYHGNFSWGKGISYYILWIIAIKIFMEFCAADNKSRKDRTKALFGYVLLAMHTISGVAYAGFLLSRRIWY